MIKIFSTRDSYDRERYDLISLGTKHDRNLTNLSKELKKNYDGDALLRCHL